MSIQKTLSGIRFEARIKTGCSSFSIRKNGDDILIEVKSPPVEGRANREIIKELKKLLKAESVQIISGLKSKKKVIFLRGEPEIIYKKLDSFW